MFTHQVIYGFDLRLEKMKDVRTCRIRGMPHTVTAGSMCLTPPAARSSTITADSKQKTLLMVLNGKNFPYYTEDNYTAVQFFRQLADT